MKHLPPVTLLGIDGLDVERLQTAMDICEQEIRFGASKLLTSLPTDDARLVRIPTIDSREAYSRYCIEELVNYVDTDFVLIVQYDGFILNPDTWDDKFLQYDYIGAPWLVHDWSVRDYDFPADARGTRIVGNGGFSLRSKKFLDVSARLFREGKIRDTHPEDVALCVWHRDLLEQESIMFAPVDLAMRFSIEGNDRTYNHEFGFHGFAHTNIDPWFDEHPDHTARALRYEQARTHRAVQERVEEGSQL